ncbi:MAG: hypothetical protein ACOZNI_07940 [Myxococcota bacterium]
MSERVETRLRFRRRPRPDLASVSADEVRAAVLRNAADLYLLAGRASPIVRFYGAGWEEELDLSDELEEGGREEACAAVLLQLAARPGVLHRFREGEVAIDRRRVLAVVELLDPATLRWRLHRRRVGEGEAGCGVLLDDWSAVEGEGLEGLPEPIREWLDVGDAKMLEFHTDEKRTGPPVPWIRAAVLEVGGEVPAGAVGMAAIVGQATDGELLARWLDCAPFFVLRGRTLERWEVRGEAACTQDDLIRELPAPRSRPLGVPSRGVRGHRRPARQPRRRACPGPRGASAGHP